MLFNADLPFDLGYQVSDYTRSRRRPIEHIEGRLRSEGQALPERRVVHGSARMLGACAADLNLKRVLWMLLRHGGLEPSNSTAEQVLCSEVIRRKRLLGRRSKV